MSVTESLADSFVWISDQEVPKIILEEKIDRASRLWGFRKNQALSAIARELVKEEDLPNALRVVKMLVNSEDKHPILYSIVEIFLQREEIFQARDVVVQEMYIEKFKARSFSLIGKKLVELKREKDAKEIVREALNVADKIPNEWDKAVAYYQILTTDLILLREIDEAIERADQIPDKWWGSIALCEIAKKTVNLGQMVPALKAANQIADKQNWWKSVAFCEIAKKLAQDGRIAEAEKCANVIVNERKKSEALLAIVEKLVEKDLIEDALTFVSKIPAPWEKSQGLYKIVCRLKDAKKLEQAREIAEIIPVLEVKDKALLYIAEKQLTDPENPV